MMDNEKREKLWASFLLALFVAAAFLSMCSCAPRYKYITQVRHDSIYINRVYTDSVYYRDSIYIDKTGDTVYKTVVKWRDRKIGSHDTIYINKVDSIPYPVEVVKTVTKANKFTTGCTAALFLLIASAVAYLFYKRRK